MIFAHAPRKVFEARLHLPPSACAQDAVRASGVLEQHPQLAQELLLGHCTLAIWGGVAEPAQALKAQDRVEICRPLQIDPKTARRERFKGQGIKRAGLFKASQGGKR